MGLPCEQYDSDSEVKLWSTEQRFICSYLQDIFIGYYRFSFLKDWYKLLYSNDDDLTPVFLKYVTFISWQGFR